LVIGGGTKALAQGGCLPETLECKGAKGKKPFRKLQERQVGVQNRYLDIFLCLVSIKYRRGSIRQYYKILWILSLRI
jgi:hypothetical protein